MHIILLNRSARTEQMPHCCMLLVFCKRPSCLRLSSPTRVPSHQGLLQPCCRLAVRWPMLPTCLYAAPMRRKPVLLLWLPRLDTLVWGEGCIISFRSSDSWINTLEYYDGFKPREARSVPVAGRLSAFVTTFWPALQRSKTSFRSVANIDSKRKEISLL